MKEVGRERLSDKEHVDEVEEKRPRREIRKPRFINLQHDGGMMGCRRKTMLLLLLLRT